MARFILNRTKAKGQVPGSLILMGTQKMENTIFQLIQYDSVSLMEKELNNIEEALPYIYGQGVTWINIYGIHDLEMIKRIGEIFNLSPLLLEDILDTDQKPKYEEGDTYDAFILKMLSLDKHQKKILAEQITIILGENYVLTLQERRGDVFAPVRERIRQKKGRIRSNENDYLAYVLMDTIFDNYTILVEDIGSKVEDMEDKIFQKKDGKIIEKIYRYKIELNYLRKSIRPVKDIVTHLLRSENTFFQEKNKAFMNDLNELVTQSTDAIELYNNLVSDQLNIYNSNIGNRMNEVMKVLTIFASIFIPLTFLAGIYGMNFEHIPELKYKYAYPTFWMVALTIGGTMLYFFKKNKWL